MNDFKQEILAAISNHPMVTSLDLMGDMMLDEGLKPIAKYHYVPASVNLNWID